MPNVQLRNTLLLMGASFIWGTAFVAQSVGADHMGPYSFLAGRSWLACVFLLGLMAVLRKAGKTNSAAEPGFWQNRKVLVKGGICCGIRGGMDRGCCSGGSNHESVDMERARTMPNYCF